MSDIVQDLVQEGTKTAVTAAVADTPAAPLAPVAGEVAANVAEQVTGDGDGSAGHGQQKSRLDQAAEQTTAEADPATPVHDPKPANAPGGGDGTALGAGPNGPWQNLMAVANKGVEAVTGFAQKNPTLAMLAGGALLISPIGQKAVTTATGALRDVTALAQMGQQLKGFGQGR